MGQTTLRVPLMLMVDVCLLLFKPTGKMLKALVGNFSVIGFRLRYGKCRIPINLHSLVNVGVLVGAFLSSCYLALYSILL
jgi:hypothetical protein